MLAQALYDEQSLYADFRDWFDAANVEIRRAILADLTARPLRSPSADGSDADLAAGPDTDAAPFAQNGHQKASGASTRANTRLAVLNALQRAPSAKEHGSATTARYAAACARLLDEQRWPVSRVEQAAWVAFLAAVDPATSDLIPPILRDRIVQARELSVILTSIAEQLDVPLSAILHADSRAAVTSVELRDFRARLLKAATIPPFVDGDAHLSRGLTRGLIQLLARDVQP